MVHNARVQRYHEELVLRGVNCELSALPGFRLNTTESNLNKTKGDSRQH